MSLFRPPRRSDNDNNPFNYKAQAVRFMWVGFVMAGCLIIAIVAVIAIIMAF